MHIKIQNDKKENNSNVFFYNYGSIFDNLDKVDKVGKYQIETRKVENVNKSVTIQEIQTIFKDLSSWGPRL